MAELQEKARDKATYTPKEFGDRLGVPDTRVRRWLREGHLKAAKVGKSWLIPHKELERLLNPDGRSDSQ